MCGILYVTTGLPSTSSLITLQCVVLGTSPRWQWEIQTNNVWHFICNHWLAIHIKPYNLTVCCFRYLSQVTVRDLQTNNVWHFICNHWLAIHIKPYNLTVCCFRYLSQVTVRDLQTNDVWHFICNHWLAIHIKPFNLTVCCFRYLTQVTVRDLQTNDVWHFICNHWLAVNIKPNLLEVLLPPATEDEMNQCGYLLKRNMAENLREGKTFFQKD